MKLWRITADREADYARACRVGTWTTTGDPPRTVRTPPLIIEWEPGSTEVGDLTWAGCGDYMVKRSVAEDLQNAGFRGFEPGPVVMRPNSDCPNRKRGIIRLPYEGPELVDLWTTKWVPIDRDKSSLQIKGEDASGPLFDLVGFERTEIVAWIRETGELVREHIPRKPGMGAYVHEASLDGCSLFQIEELPGWIVCTDPVRDFMLAKGYTNVTFFEIGDVV
jgi:hypothetical protein